MNNNNITSSRIKDVSLGERVLVRTGTFYFLEFVEYSSDIFNSNSTIISKPSLIFYTKDSEQHVIVDYSMATSEDKLYLGSFFSDMIPGVTFQLNNAEYLEETKNIQADLTSVLEFLEFKNNMIFCKVDSITSLNSAVDLYSSYYFLSTPQLEKTGALASTEKTKIPALVFSNPRTAQPLLWLGYQPGDYIQILNPDSKNNYKVLKIEDVLFVNGKEVLKLQPEYKDQIEAENLIGQNTIVNLFIDSKIDTLTNNYANDQTYMGCCINSTLNVALPQHTELQCALRGNGFVYSTGSCYGSLSNLINPITGDPVTTNEDLQVITDPLSQAMKTVINPDYLENFYKKKIVTVDTAGVILDENRKLVVDYTVNVIPILQSSLDNIAAIQAEQNISGVSVLTQIPRSIIQSFTELEGITLIPESVVYKVLNIFYEIYTTDENVIVKGLGGIPLSSNTITLNRNILTTFYETNLTQSPSERILFSSTKEVLTPVINFKEYGYDYLQLGRYHIITPIAETPTPLYIFSVSRKRSDQYISGISSAKVIPTSTGLTNKLLQPGTVNVVNSLSFYNTSSGSLYTNSGLSYT
jgi:hypothetical protein